MLIPAILQIKVVNGPIFLKADQELLIDGPHLLYEPPFVGYFFPSEKFVFLCSESHLFHIFTIV